MNIFVSSTSRDLHNERRAVIESIERIAHAVRMENFSASSESPRDECLRHLQSCDIVILILGHRYGSIDPVSGYSFTELEYRTAQELNLPVLVFLKIGKEGIWHSAEDDPEMRAKHEAFKHLAESHTRATFHSAEELQVEVLLALEHHTQKYGRIGFRGSVFQWPEQFFRTYLDSTRAVNHTFPLIGREDYVLRIQDIPMSPERVTLLSGAGGMGKSRILRAGVAALQIAHPGVTICFLTEGGTFTLEHAKELPAGPIVIVVDDAHRATPSLSDLLALARHDADRIKLILATRPYGLLGLRERLSFAGFAHQDIREVPEIRPMTQKDAERLAGEILGDQAGAVLAHLVAVSRDSPLITVITAQLYMREQLNPSLLTRDSSGAFQHDVLTRFRDELIGNVSPDLDPNLVRKVLPLVAALTPLDPDNAKLVQRAADFLHAEPDEFVSVLDALEHAGILRYHSHMLRITPDVLSDYVLEGACFTSGRHQRNLTGYGKRIIETFRNLNLPHVLQNMAELDWRISEDRARGAGLLQEVWNDLSMSYGSANYQERLSILHTIAPIAYFQPAQALAFVRQALEALVPPEIQEPGESRSPVESLLLVLAPIIRDTRYYTEYVREAAMLLWQIGRDDPRPLGSTESHPIRMLQELAAYERHKPLTYNNLVFDWLKDLVSSEDAFQHLYSPLDILPALLQREGKESWSSGRTFTIAVFPVHPGNTAILRQHVLALMQKLGRQNHVGRRRTIARDLVNVIFRSIVGIGNKRPSADDFAAWQDEDRVILSLVTDLLAVEENPMVLVEIEDSLLAIRDNPLHAAISVDVSRCIDQLPLAFESAVIRCLRQGRYQRKFLTGPQGAVDLDARNARVEQELDETLTTFLATYHSPDEIKCELERLFHFLIDAKVTPMPPSESDFFLDALCHRAPDMMMQVCDLLIADANSEALVCLPILLTALRSHDSVSILSYLDVTQAESALALRRMTARALAMAREPASEAERRSISRFALDADRDTALAGIMALGRFPPAYYPEVIAVLDQISIGDDSKLAEQICLLFEIPWGLDSAQLPHSFFARLLDKLVPLADWSHLTFVRHFIEWITLTDPEHAAAYYLARIAYYRNLPENQRMAFSVIPQVLGERSSNANMIGNDENARARALRTVRDNAMHVSRAFEVKWHTEIFSRLSHHYTDSALEALGEWIDSGESSLICLAARFLEDADSAFVFAYEGYVVHLLEVAHGLSAETFSQVRGSLLTCAEPRVYGGWVGEPDPQLESQLSQAAVARGHYLQGHIAYDFYRRLQEITEERIASLKTFADTLTEDE